MPADIGRISVKITKYKKALNVSMYSLLAKNNFRKITVKDICEQSLMSRATFYMYFADKYVFLKWWIINVWLEKIDDKKHASMERKQKINQLMEENKAIIKNIFFDADCWTLDVLYDVLLFITRLPGDKTTEGEINPQYVVTSNFNIGGMIQYILWQVENDFPQNIGIMNNYLFEIVETLQEWN